MRHWCTSVELRKAFRCPVFVSRTALVSGIAAIGTSLAAAAALGGCQDARRNAISAMLVATLFLGDGIPHSNQAEEKNESATQGPIISHNLVD
jgi:hypothetical protein